MGTGNEDINSLTNAIIGMNDASVARGERMLTRIVFVWFASPSEMTELSVGGYADRIEMVL